MMDNIESSDFISDGFEGIGTRFSNISVVRETVHNVLARAQRYGQWWLLKGLKADEAGEPVFQEMLRKEFEMMIQFQHPHVVRAFSIEPVEGLGICIVMEWIEGDTLLHFLQKGLSRETKEKLVDELLDALLYLQEKGVAHRDLKPENVMVTYNGNTVKLIDFGLADSDQYAVLKQAGGTEGYMSPEQGIGNRADTRNDIYSFGVILKEMEMGKGYEKVAARCMAPIDERPQRIEEVSAMMKKTRGRRHGLWSSRWILILSFIAVAMAVVAGVSLYKWDKLAHPGPQDYEDYTPSNLQTDEEPTLKIVNPDFHGGKGYGWTTADNHHGGFVNIGDISCGSFYIQTFNMWQVVHDLEPGEYELSVHAFHRPDSGDWSKWHYEHADDKEDGCVYSTAELYADTVSVRLLNWAAECNSEPLPDDPMFAEELVVDEIPNGLTAAGYYFNHGHYLNKLRFTLEGKDSVKIGLRQLTTRKNSLSWVAFDTFRLRKIEKCSEEKEPENVKFRRRHKTTR